MQEIRRFKPSTVSRRMAVVTGFYRGLGVLIAANAAKTLSDRLGGRS